MGMLEDWDPYHLWMVMYTKYEEPGEDFYFYCYDCIYYNNIGYSDIKNGNGYSVLVAYLSPFVNLTQQEIITNTTEASVYNSTITGANSTLMSTLINNDDDSDELATSVFNNYCVSGVHIQKRHEKNVG